MKIRQAVEEDIPALTELMNLNYLRKKRPDYFYWQYFDSVYDSELMIAVDDDFVKGMFGMQYKKLNEGTAIGQLTDLLVEKNYRGKGLFTQLGNRIFEKRKDIEIFCVFPNRQGRDAVVKAFGWSEIGRINNMILLKNEYKPDGAQIFKLHSARLIKFYSDDVIRKWRFDKNPEYDYHLIEAGNRDYCYVKKFVDPVSGILYGDIVEVISGYDNSENLITLFKRAVEYLFNKLHCTSITTWALEHYPYFRTLKEIGFRPLNAERYFCIGQSTAAGSGINNIESWYLNQSDTEIY